MMKQIAAFPPQPIADAIGHLCRAYEASVRANEPSGAHPTECSRRDVLLMQIGSLTNALTRPTMIDLEEPNNE